jgi:O-antigen ligase
MAQDSVLHSHSPVSHLAITWVLIGPLIYLVGGGTFWFQNGTRNNGLTATYGQLAGESMTGQNIVFAVCIFSVLFAVISTRARSVFGAFFQDKVFAMLCLLAITSSIWSQFPARSLEYSLCLLTDTLFTFYLIKRFDSNRLIKLVMVLGWVSLVLSIVLSLFFSEYGVDHTGISGAWRGMWNHKNVCAMTTVFLLSGAFYVSAKTLIAKWFRTLYICMSIFLILMTQSRTGWVLLACLIAYVVTMRCLDALGAHDRSVAFLLVATVTFPLVMVGISYSRELTYLIGKDPSLTGRTGIWQAVIASAMKHPILGYGYAAFWMGLQGESANASLSSRWLVTSAHNGFLEVWLSLGAVGLGLVMFTFIRVIRDAIVCFLLKNNPYLRWYICIVFLTIVLSFDEGELVVPNNFVWILYMLACLGLAEAAKRVRMESGRE